jgi:hypothetical protein
MMMMMVVVVRVIVLWSRELDEWTYGEEVGRT